MNYIQLSAHQERIIKHIIRQAICICRNDNFADTDKKNACEVAFMEKSLLRAFIHEKLMQNKYQH